MDLKGLHGSNKLWKGLYIDTTEHLKVHEGYTFEGVELIPYAGGFAESAGSVLSRHVVMPPQLNIESVVRTAEMEKSRAEVVWAKIQIWRCPKGRLKEAEGPELRRVIWDCQIYVATSSDIGIVFPPLEHKGEDQSDLTLEL